MRIAFDTEFIEDGKTIELLSIGLVREDGETYYAETESGFLLKEGTLTRGETDLSWLYENVAPSLLGTYEVCKSPRKIAAEILEFAGESPEFWAWYADYDWVALCQLYGRMIDLPKGWPMYCRDYKQQVDEYRLWVKQEDSVHNALGDAMWLARQMGFAGLPPE